MAPFPMVFVCGYIYQAKAAHDPTDDPTDTITKVNDTEAVVCALRHEAIKKQCDAAEAVVIYKSAAATSRATGTRK